MIALALVLRLWPLSAGLPHAVGIDEPAVVDRALRILRTGDWNTHLFDYPTFVIYLHAIAAAGRFLLGAVQGQWASLADMDIVAVYRSGRVVAAAIGAATVWVTYRIGRDLESRALGLLAAAQLAVLPIHVRESHFILTDVPVTALTTATVWLAIRAMRVRTARAYAWAGAAAGLAGGAKYNGAIAVTSIAVAWLVRERAAPGRGRKAAAAVAATAAAFLLAAPYTVLDLPSFLDGFAAQAGRFTGRAAPDRDPAWMLYAKHLSLSGRLWLPMAGAGAAIVLLRRGRAAWLPAIGFGLAYFYVLATHPLVFARYALPLVPIVCLLAAAPIEAAARWCARASGLPARRAILAAGCLALTVSFAIQSVRWLVQLQRPDTRGIAVAWMRGALPAGARVSVENSGPTYLDAAGFEVVPVELMVDHPVEWYLERGVAYLVVSSHDLQRYATYLAAGPIVFETAPSASRWGPPIRIVRLRPSHGLSHPNGS